MKYGSKLPTGRMGLMVQGARTLTLTPSMKDTAAACFTKNGVAGDWKRVGNDIRKSMTKVARELA